MNNYPLLGACFVLGIILRRLRRWPDNAAAALMSFLTLPLWWRLMNVL
jgi:hypothetical protein